MWAVNRTGNFTVKNRYVPHANITTLFTNPQCPNFRLIDGKITKKNVEYCLLYYGKMTKKMYDWIFRFFDSRNYDDNLLKI